MCGIVGYIGKQKCIDVVFEGLGKLEYRGYDSTGMAVMGADAKIYTEKSEGKLSKLRNLLVHLPKDSKSGLGHTRWATHGAATKANAHPHMSDKMAIVHNGIIENFRDLESELIKKGVTLKSQTDTEIVLHVLLDLYLVKKNMREALVALRNKIKGSYSLGILVEDEPNFIYFVKEGSPLVIGQSDGENMFASDALAIIEYTKKVHFLKDGEMGRISATSIELWDEYGVSFEREPTVLDISSFSVGKGGYKHFMLKEINEQPAVIAKTIQRFVDFDLGSFNESSLGLDAIDTSKVRAIHIVGCGTAYLAGLIGKYILEPVVNVPVQVELASEFRYRNPYLDQNTLVIPITQSGETADTLASLKHAIEKGCQSLAVCNVHFSTIPRTAKATLYMEAGPEIGVASTKAFTSQVLCLYILAHALAVKMQRKIQLQPMFEALKALPSQIEQSIGLGASVEKISQSYYEVKNCIYIGRSANSSVALEGALKLKEISYIHAEGYAGGELKHGPIALVDQHMPVVAICPKDRHYEKMISNIEEVRAREGAIFGIGAIGDHKFESICRDFIGLPQSTDEVLQSIINVIPLQLFAYYVACRRGTDVDQPRNLAKSVTVE